MRPGPGVRVTERHLLGEPAVRVLVATSSEGEVSRPALLWIHSGGFIMGSPQFELPIIGASRTGTRCGRGLAGLPAGPRASVPRRARRLHGDPGVDARARRRIGDRPRPHRRGRRERRWRAVSRRRAAQPDAGIPLRAQALLYPMLDDRTALRADHAGRGQFVVTPSSNRFAWTAYLGREPHMSDAPEYAAPARRTDLTGLPPAWVGVGELDLFHDEDVAYADQLEGLRCAVRTRHSPRDVSRGGRHRAKSAGNAGVPARHGGSLPGAPVAHRVRRHCAQHRVLRQGCDSGRNDPACRFRRNRLRG